MDPVTHTLVGATLARSGLADRTALGTATLLIGVNLPDIDVLAYAWSATHALWFRRGATHGVLGLLVLPLLLTGVMLLWARFARSGGSRPVLARQILLLAGLAVLSHPVLDSLNVYGMRWLMPFSSRWFYGDTLFIVDPWVWGVLSAGVWLASRRRRSGDTATGRPALIALGLMGLYVAGMAASNVLGRRIVHATLTQGGDVQPLRIMVGPVPVSPFTRYVVVDDGRHYRTGSLRWLPAPRLEIDSLVLDRFPSHYAVTAATRGPRVRRFLAWARFPYYQVEDLGEEFLVWIGDARYTLHPEGSWAAVAVEVTK